MSAHSSHHPRCLPRTVSLALLLLALSCLVAVVLSAPSQEIDLSPLSSGDDHHPLPAGFDDQQDSADTTVAPVAKPTTMSAYKKRKLFCQYICFKDPAKGGTVCNCDSVSDHSFAFLLTLSLTTPMLIVSFRQPPLYRADSFETADVL